MKLKLTIPLLFFLTYSYSQVWFQGGTGSGQSDNEFNNCSNEAFSGGQGSGNTYNIDYCLLALSIELTHFFVEKTERCVTVTWETTSEINNDYFTIQRSVDAKSWKDIGIKNGAGYSSEIQQYIFIDSIPLEGLSYYRLKQTDYNGTATFSDIKTILFSTNTKSVHLFPNPTYNSITIKGIAISDFQMFNKMGQDVTEKISVTKIGDKNIIADLNRLNAGIYHLLVDGKYYKVLKL